MLEMMPHILGGPGSLPHMNEFMLEDRLHFYKIDIHTNTKVLSTSEREVSAEQNGKPICIPADTVISAIGYKENNQLYQSLKDLDIPVYNIGDSAKVHNIMYAIWNAYELGRNI